MSATELSPDFKIDNRSKSVVELRDLHLNFVDKQVLDGISLTIAPEERLVIIGQSGAGKTTILRMILGTLRPSSGAVFFKGREISQFDHRELKQMRTRIGMVYQENPRPG